MHKIHQFMSDPEVNISPKMSISAQPLKMALHKNPAMHGSRIVIFLHESKKRSFLHVEKIFFSARLKSKLAKTCTISYNTLYCLLFCVLRDWSLVWFSQIQIVAAHDWIKHKSTQHNSTWRLSLTNIFARNPLNLIFLHDEKKMIRLPR